jgi:hypothetical protein
MKRKVPHEGNSSRELLKRTPQGNSSSELLKGTHQGNSSRSNTKNLLHAKKLGFWG